MPERLLAVFLPAARPANSILPGALGLLLACGAPTPEPLLRLEAEHLRFAPPPTVPAGLVRVRLVNRDPVWHEASIVRFTGATGTLEAYVDSARAGQEYPSFARDVGGVSFLAPGDSAEVLLDLPAGRYAVICWHRDHVLQGMGASFMVEGSASPAGRPGGAATDVTLTDYAIRFSRAPGDRPLLHVTNGGPSEHELAILELEPGRSYADFMAWRAAGEAGPPPGRTVAGTAALQPGGDLWVPLPRRPGRYLFLCLLEDSTGAYHADLGMQQSVELP